MAWETRSRKLLSAGIDLQPHVSLQVVGSRTPCPEDRPRRGAAAGPLTFAVPGSTPSVYFLSPSGKALLQALMATGRFCIARGIGASLHRHQTTLREISGSDSLHISIGPDGNQFDAHVDRYSPVPDSPGSIFCPNDLSIAALRHIGREVVPEWVRKKTGIPGVQLFPDFELTPTVPRPEPATRQEAGLPPPLVGITWRF